MSIKKSNIIKDAIIKQTLKILSEKRKKAGVDILWFEKKIKTFAYNSKETTIDSISLFPNGSGGFGSILWEELDGVSLMCIKRSLSNDDFYFFKNIKVDGREQRVKTRFKKL